MQSRGWRRQRRCGDWAVRRSEQCGRDWGSRGQDWGSHGPGQRPRGPRGHWAQPQPDHLPPGVLSRAPRSPASPGLQFPEAHRERSLGPSPRKVWGGGGSEAQLSLLPDSVLHMRWTSAWWAARQTEGHPSAAQLPGPDTALGPATSGYPADPQDADRPAGPLKYLCGDLGSSAQGPWPS